MFTKSNPGPESQLLSDERIVAEDASTRPHARILGMLEARVGGRVRAVPQDMLERQAFPGLSFVGITATLNGQRGLLSQCAWFEDDNAEWFWVKITNVRSIEPREDSRFRGGMPCLWLVTDFAEYAMMTPHKLFDEEWESTLEHFGMPRCDMWPTKGVRPDWWPVELASDWPYDRSIREQYAALMTVDPLVQRANNLSLEPTPTRTPWRRLGPKGDVQIAGRPRHHLSQMSEWFIVPDTGMRKTRRQANLDEDDKDGSEGGDGEKANDKQGSDKGKRKGRRPARERALKRIAPGSAL
ncbi:hypothetical protein CTheo_8207 [Ceratobasidium theobromae]|uniref:Uncharacterized protein n=1 Tax=Ceratobasidium theobromae TaxID=1582974 RepID=A0A5N5Q9L6_9AGAM|nr:hypothetical protein CTheo_8207 [Ceratobasidium theobromae]